jgi:hypothetical protein
MGSGNATYAHPYAALVSTDRGGVLLAVNTICLIISLFSVALRVGISKRRTKGHFAVFKDDLLCFAAAVCTSPTPRGASY